MFFSNTKVSNPTRAADSTSFFEVKDLQGGLASDYELEDELGHGGTSPQLSSGDAERGAAFVGHVWAAC